MTWRTPPLVLATTPRTGDEALKSGGGKRVNRHPPTFGLWPVALRDDLRDSLTGGLRKVVLWPIDTGVARRCLRQSRSIRSSTLTRPRIWPAQRAC